PHKTQYAIYGGEKMASGRLSSQELPFRQAHRLQDSLVARLEKLLLVWMAERTPCWVNPDHLTLLGFTAQLLTGVSYGLARSNKVWLLAGIGFLALNWLGDSMDGTLARVRQQQRPRYGFYVDHVVDAFGAAFLLGGLALSGHMHPYIALGVLVAYLMLCVETFLATHCLGTFKMSYFKVGPTE